jgi:hypothetical protein
LFRTKKELLDGTPLGDDAPKGIQEVEAMDGFTGWEYFAEGAPHGWDISEEEPYVIVARNHSIQTEWHAELSRTVKPLPVVEVKDDGSEGSV